MYSKLKHPKKNNWIIPIYVPINVKQQLFAFHHAGASSSIFYAWKDYLDNKTALYAIELPGRGTRFGEELIDDIDFIIDNITKAIVPFIDDKKIYFFGHSMGGVLAYEVILLLIQKKILQDTHLIVSAVSPPKYKQISFVEEHLYDNEKFEKILLQYDGIDQLLLENDEFKKVFFPIIRADFKAMFRYKRNVEKKPIDANITCILADNDKFVSIEKGLYWKEYTSKLFNFNIVKGKHLFINDINIIMPIISNILSLS